MGFSKNEVNLRRLLAVAPQQQNQAKLIHYVLTLRKQLEQLVAETTPEGLPRISEVKVKEFLGKIEALTAKSASPQYFMPGSTETVDGTMVEEIPSKTEERINVPYLPGLRKRSHLKVEEIIHGISETDSPTPKLDAMEQAHIDKHRNLQENLIDEMVGLAHQLRESSFMMNLSSQQMKKLVDSTERALDHSLASTGSANMQTMEIYTQGSNTTCFTWLVIFIMTSIFIAVVLLIRVT